ncbi:MAG TPA: hypothetical protein DD723_09320 [Candidatus Omnitrophica bacterium]|nr:MAG: hypothetical protein A2Y04_05425 [Omnitrophica WOR_2 bacterium GWC2_45_7]HBR15716.1 hypothetical protein [Candidatus Omnitrophota bacterium]
MKSTGKFIWFFTLFLGGMIALQCLRGPCPLSPAGNVLSSAVDAPAAPAKKTYTRIVSLLPSVTEILYALKVEDRIVGVTRFCKFPPEARQKPQVGGYMDTNYEAVYRLRPDLVLVETRDSNQKEKFEEMGLEVLEADTKSVRGVLDSIRFIGGVLDREEIASLIVKDIEAKITEIEEKTKDMPRPRVLVTFMRPLGEGRVRDVYISGNNSYFHDLIWMSGGQNAYDGPKHITSPIVSPEGILQMNPDVIIEIMTRLGQTNFSVDDALKDWDSLSEVKAYQNKRIYVLTDNYLDIPGPRLKLALEVMARCIHPEVSW